MIWKPYISKNTYHQKPWEMDILLILYEYSSDFLHYIIFVPPSLEATRCCNYERAPYGKEKRGRWRKRGLQGGGVGEKGVMGGSYFVLLSSVWHQNLNERENENNQTICIISDCIKSRVDIVWNNLWYQGRFKGGGRSNKPHHLRLVVHFGGIIKGKLA